MLSILGSAQNFILPHGASTVAPMIDWLLYFILWVSVFFGALVFIGTGWLAWRYRHRPGINDIGTGPTHSNLLEIVWSVIPGIIVLLIAIWGFQGYMALSVLPPPNDVDTIEIEVEAYKWGWNFIYPNGHSEPTLHVPKDTKIRLILTSRDVIHDLYLVQFRTKKDVVPGRYNKYWFEATETSPLKEGLNPSQADTYESGVDVNDGFDIFCAEYCGTGHSRMRSKVYVHPDRASYSQWLTEASDVYRKDAKGIEPKAKDVGLKLARNGGCFGCHSVTGEKGTGPTWKDMFGNPVTLSSPEAQTLTVDENYIRDSILYPQKQLVAGFGPAMPSYLGKFSDRDITALIAYMKSISSAYQGPKDDLEKPVPAPTTKPKQ